MGEDHTKVSIVAAIVVATLIILGAMAGYHIIMKMQAVLTWLTGITTIIYVILVIPHINWEVLTSIPAGPFPRDDRRHDHGDDRHGPWLGEHRS